MPNPSKYNPLAELAELEHTLSCNISASLYNNWTRQTLLDILKNLALLTFSDKNAIYTLNAVQLQALLGAGIIDYKLFEHFSHSEKNARVFKITEAIFLKKLAAILKNPMQNESEMLDVVTMSYWAFVVYGKLNCFAYDCDADTDATLTKIIALLKQYGATDMAIAFRESASWIIESLTEHHTTTATIGLYSLADVMDLTSIFERFPESCVSMLYKLRGKSLTTKLEQILLESDTITGLKGQTATNETCTALAPLLYALLLERDFKFNRFSTTDAFVHALMNFWFIERLKDFDDIHETYYNIAYHVFQTVPVSEKLNPNTTSFNITSPLVAFPNTYLRGVALASKKDIIMQLSDKLDWAWSHAHIKALYRFRLFLLTQYLLNITQTNAILKVLASSYKNINDLVAMGQERLEQLRQSHNSVSVKQERPDDTISNNDNHGNFGVDANDIFSIYPKGLMGILPCERDVIINHVLGAIVLGGVVNTLYDIPRHDSRETYADGTFYFMGDKWDLDTVNTVGCGNGDKDLLFPEILPVFDIDITEVSKISRQLKKCDMDAFKAVSTELAACYDFYSTKQSKGQDKQDNTTLPDTFSPLNFCETERRNKKALITVHQLNTNSDDTQSTTTLNGDVQAALHCDEKRGCISVNRNATKQRKKRSNNIQQCLCKRCNNLLWGTLLSITITAEHIRVKSKNKRGIVKHISILPRELANVITQRLDIPDTRISENSHDRQLPITQLINTRDILNNNQDIIPLWYQTLHKNMISHVRRPGVRATKASKRRKYTNKHVTQHAKLHVQMQRILQQTFYDNSIICKQLEALPKTQRTQYISSTVATIAQKVFAPRNYTLQKGGKSLSFHYVQLIDMIEILREKGVNVDNENELLINLLAILRMPFSAMQKNNMFAKKNTLSTFWRSTFWNLYVIIAVLTKLLLLHNGINNVTNFSEALADIKRHRPNNQAKIQEWEDFWGWVNKKYPWFSVLVANELYTTTDVDYVLVTDEKTLLKSKLELQMDETYLFDFDSIPTNVDLFIDFNFADIHNIAVASVFPEIISPELRKMSVNLTLSSDVASPYLLLAALTPYIASKTSADKQVSEGDTFSVNAQYIYNTTLNVLDVLKNAAGITILNTELDALLKQHSKLESTNSQLLSNIRHKLIPSVLSLLKDERLFDQDTKTRIASWLSDTFAAHPRKSLITPSGIYKTISDVEGDNGLLLQEIALVIPEDILLSLLTASDTSANDVANIISE